MTDAPPVPRSRRLKVLAIVIVVLGVVADLWTKADMQDRLGMSPDQPHVSEREIHVIPGYVKLAGNWNTGVTFGMAAGWTQPILLFTCAASLGILAWLLLTRSTSRALHVALALILSGALGNLYDRWTWHKVRDFLVVYWKDTSIWQWPAFNVADSLIVSGVILILWLELFGRRGEPARAP